MNSNTSDSSCQIIITVTETAIIVCERVCDCVRERGGRASSKGTIRKCCSVGDMPTNFKRSRFDSRKTIPKVTNF